MADYHGPLAHPKAKKKHQCIYCGGPIPVGEKYVQQEGFFDGYPYRNRYHAECYKTCGDECAEYGDWEFTPYSGEVPERIRLLMASEPRAIRLMAITEDRYEL